MGLGKWEVANLQRKMISLFPLLLLLAGALCGPESTPILLYLALFQIRKLLKCSLTNTLSEASLKCLKRQEMRYGRHDVEGSVPS